MFLIFFFGIVTHNFVFRILNIFGSLTAALGGDCRIAPCLGPGLGRGRGHEIFAADCLAGRHRRDDYAPGKRKAPWVYSGGALFSSQLSGYFRAANSQMASRCERGEQNLRAKWQTRVEVFAVFAQVSPSRGKGAGGSGGVHGMVRSTSGGSSGGGWAMDSG